METDEHPLSIASRRARNRLESALQAKRIADADYAQALEDEKAATAKWHGLLRRYRDAATDDERAAVLAEAS